MNFLSKLNTFIFNHTINLTLTSITMAAEGSSGPTSLDMITSPAGIFV